MSPSRKREAVVKLQNEVHGVRAKGVSRYSISRVAVSVTRRSLGTTKRRLVKRMLDLVRQRPRFGYRRIAALLRAESWRASATRIFRLWRQEGLKVPQKKRKRRRLGQERERLPSASCGMHRTTSGAGTSCSTARRGQPAEVAVDRRRVHAGVLGLEGRSEHHERGRDRHAGRAVRDAWRAAVHSQRQRPGVHRARDSALAQQLASRRCTSSQAARGRTATPRASTVGCETSSWPSKSSRVWRRRGSSPRLGETITTTIGRTARWGTSPQPSSRPALLRSELASATPQPTPPLQQQRDYPVPS